MHERSPVRNPIPPNIHRVCGPGALGFTIILRLRWPGFKISASKGFLFETRFYQISVISSYDPRWQPYIICFSSRIKGPPVGVAWKFSDSVPAQVLCVSSLS
ncbi:hypothetical protein AVEN_127402-1 [Araneus ventricosus]|uniref:Uncharacterized protein n=1 Tax=Araneus ventricosus TaxID=182803 RepID=A0A4Y2UAA4_ARAVE|nr:hypothetical protein AVEN_127402-1 [Araneus ventricosus]